MNLERLTIDARVAKELALTAAALSEDGGSCNLDGTFLMLEKGQRSGPVVAALNAAGLAASATRWLGRGVMVSPPGAGQANKRYASNQALFKQMDAAGWRVVPYCQMD